MTWRGLREGLTGSAVLGTLLLLYREEEALVVIAGGHLESLHDFTGILGCEMNKCEMMGKEKTGGDTYCPP